MPKTLRFQPHTDMIHVVSMRCLQGFSFLKPHLRLNQIIAGVLSRALSRFEVEINLYAYVFMSNHYHLILKSYNQQSLSKFMQYFNQNLSRELSKLYDWKHHFWQSTYASHIVLDEEALVNQFKYVLSNSVKEGLVSHPQLWPGLHCYSQIVERKRVKGIWIDRTSLYNAKRLKANEHLTEEDFSLETELKLSRPECWVHLSDDEYREMIRQWSLDICEAHRGMKFLGVQGVKEAEVFMSRIPKVSQRPLCKAGCMKLWIEFKKAYKAFRTQYYIASRFYHDAQTEDAKIEARSLYPEGGFVYLMVPT